VIRNGSTVALLAVVCTLSACGTTYVDTDVTVPETGPTTTTSLPPIVADAPLDGLLAEIEMLLSDLDRRIVETDHEAATLERISELWLVAERQIRDVNPDDVFNFKQAIELATSGVNRLRPADASKAYKVWVTVNAEYRGP
jgi:hypothetical protein